MKIFYRVRRQVIPKQIVDLKSVIANNNNNNYYYLLQFDCHPVAVVILHVNKT